MMLHLLETARDEIDENGVAIFQDGRQVFRSRSSFTALAVSDASRIAFRI